MLAAPVTADNSVSSGPRPINLGKDVRPVLALLNTSFGPLRDRDGRVVSDRFSLSQSAPFARRLSMMSRGFIPGFVWEESGRIVGNVTLLESPIFGRYLVANVAVHPDYRRIAAGAMTDFDRSEKKGLGSGDSRHASKKAETGSDKPGAGQNSAATSSAGSRRNNEPRPSKNVCAPIR